MFVADFLGNNYIDGLLFVKPFAQHVNMSSGTEMIKELEWDTLELRGKNNSLTRGMRIITVCSSSITQNILSLSDVQADTFKSMIPKEWSVLISSLVRSDPFPIFRAGLDEVSEDGGRLPECFLIDPCNVVLSQLT